MAFSRHYPSPFTAKSLEDDIDFSDDSFDDIDSQDTETYELSIVDERPLSRQVAGTSFAVAPPPPPPKPARTFEHDIYMQFKQATDTDTESSRMSGVGEHVYEPVGHEPYENLDRITLDKVIKMNPHLTSHLNLRTGEQFVGNGEVSHIQRTFLLGSLI